MSFLFLFFFFAISHYRLRSLSLKREKKEDQGRVSCPSHSGCCFFPLGPDSEVFSREYPETSLQHLVSLLTQRVGLASGGKQRASHSFISLHLAFFNVNCSCFYTEESLSNKQVLASYFSLQVPAFLKILG